MSNKIKKSLEERIKTVSKSLNQSPGDLLYHYTTGYGFIEIIKNQEIWATNIRYMNDAKEFGLSIEIAQKEIEYKIQKFKNNTNLCKLLNAMVVQLKSVETVQHICVVSFSKKKSQLSQWRAYSGEYGYAIGFRPECLEELAKNQEFSLRPCIYDHTEQKNIIDEIINHHIEDAEDATNAGQTLNSAEISKIVIEFHESIVKYSPIIKHKSFEEEEEWRLISMRPIGVLREELREKIEYRPGKSMIIPYFKFKLCRNNRKFNIAEVIVGPTPHEDLAIAAIDSFLDKYNVYDFTEGRKAPVNIYLSGITYYSW